MTYELHALRRRITALASHDAAGGIMMIALTIIALIYQNSPYALDYRDWLNLKAGITFGNFELIKPLLLWINDGLITLFFFSIGLELKHEFLEGHLSKKANLILPSLAALGGIIMPSAVFTLCNLGDAYALRGWAIPTATDTAFSLAILLMLGSRVPASLRVFLLSLAIFDDIGAIIVIAIFYTSKLSAAALCFAVLTILGLFILNRLGVTRKSFYYALGALLWFSILKSGVHATLAGIITAFFIPLKKADGSPLVMEIFEHLKLHIAIFIMPIFAFANAGLDLSGITLSNLFDGVPVGIFLGLFVGKQLGVFGMTYLCLRLKWAQMPKGATLKQIYGVCILTGIGFTMSLFINGLAYWSTPIFGYADSLAILLASVVSGIVGYLYLRFFASDPLPKDLKAHREYTAAKPAAQADKRTPESTAASEAANTPAGKDADALQTPAAPHTAQPAAQPWVKARAQEACETVSTNAPKSAADNEAPANEAPKTSAQHRQEQTAAEVSAVKNSDPAPENSGHGLKLLLKRKPKLMHRLSADDGAAQAGD